MQKQPGCWLRSSHSFKECVIAHWSSGFAPKMIGTKCITEAMDFQSNLKVVEEHSVRLRRCTGRYAGAIRRDYAGMSSENLGEKPRHRKSKVS